jgi:hypothetical protein
MTQSSHAVGRRRGVGNAFAMPVSGGVATFAEADSPFNKVAGASPPRGADGAALGAARRCRRGGMRHRRRHHPARVQVAAERTAAGIRSALHPSCAGQESLSSRSALVRTRALDVSSVGDGVLLADLLDVCEKFGFYCLVGSRHSTQVGERHSSGHQHDHGACPNGGVHARSSGCTVESTISSRWIRSSVSSTTSVPANIDGPPATCA